MVDPGRAAAAGSHGFVDMIVCLGLIRTSSSMAMMEMESEKLAERERRRWTESEGGESVKWYC